jgi:hypothetical protein
MCWHLDYFLPLKIGDQIFDHVGIDEANKLVHHDAVAEGQHRWHGLHFEEIN